LSTLVSFCSLSFFLSTNHVNTGISLRKSVEKAWKWSKTQREVAKSLNEMVSEDTLLKWKNMVIDYKLDHTKPNPFEEPQTGTFFPFPLVSIVC